MAKTISDRATPPEKLLVLSGPWNRDSWVWDFVAGMPPGSVLVTHGQTGRAARTARAAATAMDIASVVVNTENELDVWRIYQAVPGKPVCVLFGAVHARWAGVIGRADQVCEMHRIIDAPMPGGALRLAAGAGREAVRVLVGPSGQVQPGDVLRIDDEAMRATEVLRVGDLEDIITVVRGVANGAGLPTQTAPHKAGALVRVLRGHDHGKPDQ